MSFKVTSGYLSIRNGHGIIAKAAKVENAWSGYDISDIQSFQVLNTVAPRECSCSINLRRYFFYFRLLLVYCFDILIQYLKYFYFSFSIATIENNI